MKKILFVILSLFLVSCRPLYTAFCVSNKSSMPIAVCADFLPKGDTVLKKATHWILLDSNETEDFQLNDYEYKKLKSGDTLTIFIVKNK